MELGVKKGSSLYESVISFCIHTLYRSSLSYRAFYVAGTLWYVIPWSVYASS
jgi:hypothetical protein